MQRPATIVIAEDDPAFRNVLEFSFSRRGFNVEGFSDGEFAFTRIRQGGVDFLVSDHQMPRCSGVELLQRIRDDETLPDLPTVLCTAKGLELDVLTLQQQFSIVAVMHKPFSPRKLCEVVRQHLDQTPAAADSRSTVPAWTQQTIQPDLTTSCLNSLGATGR